MVGLGSNAGSYCNTDIHLFNFYLKAVCLYSMPHANIHLDFLNYPMQKYLCSQPELQFVVAQEIIKSIKL